MFIINKVQKIRDEFARMKRINSEVEEYIRFSEMTLEASLLHQKVFPKYKNCLRGKSVAVFGAGQSLDQYAPLSDVVQMGVNGAFTCDKLALDFLFYQDYISRDRQDKINNYRLGKCKKFYGIHYMGGLEAVIPEFDALKADAERYFFYDLPKHIFPFDFTYDLAAKPFITYSSTIFIPLQFALYTHPDKLYIVGCDCANTGHFKNCDTFQPCPSYKNMDGLENILSGWKKFKRFQEAFYPDIEVISVNPVGLKGMFKDLYQ